MTEEGSVKEPLNAYTITDAQIVAAHTLGLISDTIRDFALTPETNPSGTIRPYYRDVVAEIINLRRQRGSAIDVLWEIAHATGTPEERATTCQALARGHVGWRPF